MDEVVSLNVGGVQYCVSRTVLLKDAASAFSEWFSSTPPPLPVDSRGAYFIDRDGVLFRFILDFLRTERLILPENFDEFKRLKNEAHFYKITLLLDQLRHIDDVAVPMKRMSLPSTGDTRLNMNGYITVGYQGTFSFGPQGLPAADVNFRKIMRILVSGRVSICREVFGETLNEGRDPDRGHSNDRYTARYYLKHNILEQAFDMLGDANFKLVTSCASGTTGNAEPKPGSNTEEDRWAHYSEFVFYRP